ncbi:50S ribosomal protein L21 [Candidatus Roizmanbacteria bacterium RIFCSPHIGHO2_01_FULL_39_12b]|uniref:50S ribosomal protein L21 n=1 Tax=Candidatus Roizmanbacteria bacterium RIFCSPHIGHO2_01_FULL_39_12b TaxID=1802030 RepID=A0A1F7GDR7_9BACT|nr:MAG: 50S ribosomal protein L21 [Candidatus Roizmanbacteria bacterium RIFCSPHIGHO2_01_FULL_39_12b]OGK46657.1 MAG: 50S ribosomal protein L21 [Candidatus Roizmanbacteria bacterium RIFCSPLOWO2_01_FULL_39_19]
MKFAVVKTGGKQYLVRENEEIIVDFLSLEPKKTVELEKLAEGNLETGAVSVGKPLLKTTTKAEILENVKGDKLRVARFRAKTRTRKVTGFRPILSKIKIVGL